MPPRQIVIVVPEMEIKYFQDTDSLLINFTNKEIVETRDLNEHILIEFDLDKEGSRVEYERMFGVSLITAKRDLHALLAKSFIEKIGDAQLTRYKGSQWAEHIIGEVSVSYRYRIGIISGQRGTSANFELDDDGNVINYSINDIFLSVREIDALGGDTVSIEIPSEYTLRQNYPNPFNPKTIIHYQLPVASNVELVIYNVLGQKIRTLVSTHQGAGYYHVEWDGKNDAGVQVASGVYLCRLRAGDFVQMKKMLLMRQKDDCRTISRRTC